MAGSTCNNAKQYLDAMSDLLARMDASAIDALGEWVCEAWRDDRQVLTLGNGGSASTASHFVADLVKTAEVPGRRRLRALALVDNFAMTTALGNDVSYEQTLAHPLETYARPGDLVIAISCSGASPNVVAACRWAKANDCRLVCLTGRTGGEIGGMADLHVNVPSDNYGLIEDLHLSIGHIISQVLQQRVTEASGS